MRTCRICLKTDIMNDMISCFENIDLIIDLNFLANVSIVELDGSQAKICRRCAKNVKQSADFKRLCVASDIETKKVSAERFFWFAELQKLKVTESVDVNYEEHKNTSTAVTNDEDKLLGDIIDEVNKIMEEIDNYGKNKKMPQTNGIPELNENQPIIDFIKQLSNKQIRELTSDLQTVLDSDIFSQVTHT